MPRITRAGSSTARSIATIRSASLLAADRSFRVGIRASPACRPVASAGWSFRRNSVMARVGPVASFRRTRHCCSTLSFSAFAESPLLKAKARKDHRSFRASVRRKTVLVKNSALRVDHRLEALQGQHADLLARGLGLERHLVAGEGVHAFTCLRCGLLDDLHLQQTGQGEQAVTAQALLDHAAE